MPDYGITSGLPQLPVVPEQLFGPMVTVYNAINALAKAISIASGTVTYSQAELAARNQLGSINSQNQNVIYPKALANLTYGQIVTLSLDSGKLAADLADATTALKPAHGVVDEPLGIASGNFGRVVFLHGFTPGIAGSTVGIHYWLSTGGLVQLAAPTVSGSIKQAVGVGLGSAGFMMNVSSYYEVNP